MKNLKLVIGNLLAAAMVAVLGTIIFANDGYSARWLAFLFGERISAQIIELNEVPGSSRSTTKYSVTMKIQDREVVDCCLETKFVVGETVHVVESEEPQRVHIVTLSKLYLFLALPLFLFSTATILILSSVETVSGKALQRATTIHKVYITLWLLNYGVLAVSMFFGMLASLQLLSR